MSLYETFVEIKVLQMSTEHILMTDTSIDTTLIRARNDDMILKRTELLENETQNNLEKVDQNRTELLESETQVKKQDNNESENLTRLNYLREIPYFSKILRYKNLFASKVKTSKLIRMVLHQIGGKYFEWLGINVIHTGRWRWDFDFGIFVGISEERISVSAYEIPTLSDAMDHEGHEIMNHEGCKVTNQEGHKVMNHEVMNSCTLENRCKQFILDYNFRAVIGDGSFDFGMFARVSEERIGALAYFLSIKSQYDIELESHEAMDHEDHEEIGYKSLLYEKQDEPIEIDLISIKKQLEIMLLIE
ncbi:9583_t:CDS:2, partial [Gigaspora margarita]